MSNCYRLKQGKGNDIVKGCKPCTSELLLPKFQKKLGEFQKIDERFMLWKTTLMALWLGQPNNCVLQFRRELSCQPLKQGNIKSTSSVNVSRSHSQSVSYTKSLEDTLDSNSQKFTEDTQLLVLNLHIETSESYFMPLPNFGEKTPNESTKETHEQ